MSFHLLLFIWEYLIYQTRMVFMYRRKVPRHFKYIKTYVLIEHTICKRLVQVCRHEYITFQARMTFPRRQKDISFGHLLTTPCFKVIILYLIPILHKDKKMYCNLAIFMTNMYWEKHKPQNVICLSFYHFITILI